MTATRIPWSASISAQTEPAMAPPMIATKCSPFSDINNQYASGPRNEYNLVPEWRRRRDEQRQTPRAPAEAYAFALTHHLGGSNSRRPCDVTLGIRIRDQAIHAGPVKT